MESLPVSTKASTDITSSNPDDLVKILHRVRKERSEQRLFKRVLMDFDDDDDNHYTRLFQKRKTTYNHVNERLVYINKYMLMGGIETLPLDYLGDEDSLCGVLYDLANFPLPLVLDRLQSEGAIVDK